MQYTVKHATSYRYTSPVSVCHNKVMLEPRQFESLSCESFQLDVQPAPGISGRRTDMFGNHVHRLSLEENHSQLTIVATSQVTVRPRILAADNVGPSCADISVNSRTATDPNWLQVAPFFFDSPRIKRSQEFVDFAGSVLLPDKPVVEAAMDLTRKIFEEFAYDKNATQVDTPTSTAFSVKRGVCQDFAHVAVACFRSCNLPAKYVSGYLRTIPQPGTKRLIGNDESHAWVSVYCGSELGWIDFDPTNNCLCGSDHIPIAHGRDYGDVVPVKGIFLGGGRTTLSVSVDVTEIPSSG